VEISHQPYEGALGDTLIEQIESGKYQQLEFMVAFARQSGVLRLKSSFDKLRTAGGTISAFVGIDMDGTSYDALQSLMALCDEVYVVHTESMSQTFHSKVYVLTSADLVWATVASNNLTYSGLWKNIESYATETLHLKDPAGAARAARLKERVAKLRDGRSGVSRLLSEPADLSELFAQGYVMNELSVSVRTRERQIRERSGRRLFAAQIPHSTGPVIPPVSTGYDPPAAPVAENPSPTVRSTWVGEVFWTESGAMTSDARNQLDLSMSGRVDAGNPALAGYEDRPGWAMGSVSFFGVTPLAQHEARQITLNYLGVDYSHNRVYFPDSPGANGTWRIQLNGTDAAGVRLDHRVGGDGFVRKILAFQRISEDYYSLRILRPAELSSLRDASSFVARNGGSPNGKLYGVFTAVE